MSCSVPRTKPLRAAEVREQRRRGRRRSQRDAGELAERRRAAARTEAMYSRGQSCAAIRRDRLGQPDDRVVVVGHRAVAGPAVGAQPQPGDALLGGLQQVGAAGSPVAASATVTL